MKSENGKSKVISTNEEVKNIYDATIVAKQFGENVKRGRIALGFSQQELAGRVPITVKTLEKIENGYGANLDTMCGIANALQVRLSYLLPETPDTMELFLSETILRSQKILNIIKERK